MITKIVSLTPTTHSNQPMGSEFRSFPIAIPARTIRIHSVVPWWKKDVSIVQEKTGEENAEIFELDDL